MQVARSALITIDVQRDTLDGQPLEISGTSAVLPNLAALCGGFRNARLPIVHMVRLYKADGSNAEACRLDLVRGEIPVLRPGTTGRLLAQGLLPDGAADLSDEVLLSGGLQHVSDNEVVIYKPRWGAFFGTPLETHLRTLGVTEIVFVGCNFPNCPRTSIYEASERDFEVALVEDAISGLYDRGRDEMLGIGVAVVTAADVLDALEEANTAPR